MLEGWCRKDEALTEQWRLSLSSGEQIQLRRSFHRTGLTVKELADEAGVSTHLVEMMLGFRAWSARELHPSRLLVNSRYLSLLQNAEHYGEASQGGGRPAAEGV